MAGAVRLGVALLKLAVIAWLAQTGWAMSHDMIDRVTSSCNSPPHELESRSCKLTCGAEQAAGRHGPSSFPNVLNYLKQNVPPSAVIGATLQMAPHIRLNTGFASRRRECHSAAPPLYL